MISLPEKLGIPILQVPRGFFLKIDLILDENSAFFQKKSQNAIRANNPEKCTKKSSKDVLGVILIQF